MEHSAWQAPSDLHGFLVRDAEISVVDAKDVEPPRNLKDIGFRKIFSYARGMCLLIEGFASKEVPLLNLSTIQPKATAFISPDHIERRADNRGTVKFRDPSAPGQVEMHIESQSTDDPTADYRVQEYGVLIRMKALADMRQKEKVLLLFGGRNFFPISIFI